MKREHVLLGLLLLIVVLVFVLSVGIGRDDSRADPDDSGGIEQLQRLIGSLPGVGTALTADDVAASCFDRADRSFTVGAAPAACGFVVADGIDRVRLGVSSGRCIVAIRDQRDTFDQKFDTADWDDGFGDLSLVGAAENGNQTTIVIDNGPCRLVLDP